MKPVPAILVFRRVRIVIYPNDHRPAHFHLIGRGCEAVFNLNCRNGPPELREDYGFSRRELTQFQNALQANLEELCAAWERIHDIA